MSIPVFSGCVRDRAPPLTLYWMLPRAQPDNWWEWGGDVRWWKVREEKEGEGGGDSGEPLNGGLGCAQEGRVQQSTWNMLINFGALHELKTCFLCSFENVLESFVPY